MWQNLGRGARGSKPWICDSDEHVMQTKAGVIYSFDHHAAWYRRRIR